MTQKEAEIRQKIDDGNRAVAAKQTELDTANQTIVNLQQQLANKKPPVDDQALQDVEATKAKADKAVNDTK